MKEEGEHRLADRLWEETGKLIPSRRGPRHFPSWCTPVYSSETFRSREREGRLMPRESVPLSLSPSLCRVSSSRPRFLYSLPPSILPSRAVRQMIHRPIDCASSCQLNYYCVYSPRLRNQPDGDFVTRSKLRSIVACP